MNRSHLWRYFPYCLFLPFLLVSCYYISNYHVWPLSRDQWHMYAPYFSDGFWATMLSPMSNHRHVFPFFLFHMDMSLFHGLNHFLVAMGALFDVLFILILVVAIKQDAELSSLEKSWLAVFIATQFTWLLNIAQLGWGFMSTQYYLAILTLFAAIVCARRYTLEDRRQYRWGALTLTCGVISTFSFGMGILVWPILLYFIWVWRAPTKCYLPVILALFACLLLFFILPGGESVEQALIFFPLDTLRFTLQLPAGPIYYLLKSWRILDLETVKTIAITVGTICSLIAIGLIITQIIKRKTLSLFETMCLSMMLTGLGTAAIISFSRPAGLLDIWADRYQIWGTMLWSGLLPLLYLRLRNAASALHKPVLYICCSLPLLAFPAQLDLGSRLYEYTTRVQKSLLFYQISIPDKEAASDALHWNWENKLTYLFPVLASLNANDKNIFYQSPAKYIGKPRSEIEKEFLLSNLEVIPLKIAMISEKNLLSKDSLAAQDIPPEYLNNYIFKVNSGPVAYSLHGKAKLMDTDKKKWKFAVGVDDSGNIVGLGLHIDHSKLPRPAANFSAKKYNFFSIYLEKQKKRLNWYATTPRPDI